MEVALLGELLLSRRGVPRTRGTLSPPALLTLSQVATPTVGECERMGEKGGQVGEEGVG